MWRHVFTGNIVLPAAGLRGTRPLRPLEGGLRTGVNALRWFKDRATTRRDGLGVVCFGVALFGNHAFTGNIVLPAAGLRGTRPLRPLEGGLRTGVHASRCLGNRELSRRLVCLQRPGNFAPDRLRLL